MNVLRTARSADDRFNSSTRIQGGTITLTFDDSVVEEVRVEDYPYREQEILTGTLSYEGEVLVNGLPSNTETYDVSYRTESGLIRISGIDDYSQAQSVIADTNRAVDGPPVTRVPFSRLGLWSFVFAGDQQARIEVIDAENNQYVDLEEFEDMSRKELARQYDLYAATIHFTSLPGISDTYVKYSNGKISFGSNTTNAGRECVLQLYEKHVVDGQILSELNREDEESRCNVEDSA